jgi:hypothetical protein
MDTPDLTFLGLTYISYRHKLSGLDWICLLGPMRGSHAVTVAALHLKVCVMNKAIQAHKNPRVVHEGRTGHSRRLTCSVASLDTRSAV